MTTAALKQDLDRVLEPLERHVLILAARFGRDPANLRRELEWIGGGSKSEAVIAAALRSAEEKVRSVVEKRAALPREPDRRRALPRVNGNGSGPVPVAGPARRSPRKVRPSVRLPSSGKSVTLPETLPKDPVRRDQMEAAHPPTAPAEDFAARAERALAELESLTTEAQQETARVLADLDRLNFRADQVTRVLRALKLPVPRKLEYLVDWVELAKDHEEEDAELGKREAAAPPTPEPPPPAPEEPPTPPPAPAPDLPPAADARGPEKPPEAPGTLVLLTGKHRTEAAAEAALRKMGSGITTERLMSEWRLTNRRQAEKVITHFYGRLLQVEKLPYKSAPLVYSVIGVGASAFADLPVPHGWTWEQMPAWGNPERRGATNEAVARQQAAVLAILERDRMVSSELARALPMMHEDRVDEARRTLAAAGLIVQTGVRRRGKHQTTGRYSEEWKAELGKAATREARPEEEVAAAAPPVDAVIEEPDAGQLAKVRDWVVNQKRPFTVSQAVESVGLREAVVRGAFAKLIERQAVAYVGMDDLELYEYVKPTEPGKAAELDAKRRKAATNGNGGAQPVAGTGAAGQFTPHKPTNDLLKSCVRAGAEVEKTGSGHFAILNPATRQRVIVGSTEGSSGNSKTKKRLAEIGIAI